MALTAQQMDYLRTADQRFRAKVAVFDAFTLTATNPEVDDAGEQLAPLPLPRMSSRYSVVANSGEITLDATESRNRDGSYVGDGNVSWALTGDGSLNDNSNGTATYTAPASGIGTATITLTVANGNGSKDSYGFVQYPDTAFDDEVAEIATISGGLEQHGWKMTMRVLGSAAAFTLGKGILLHVEDTWGPTTSTFGGHRYAEGVFFGYIADVKGFEDGAGDYWTGIELRSPWWLLERVRVGETWWSLEAQSGAYYLSDFAPADAVWHFLNDITDWSAYHDTTIWTDGNVVDDFIIHASDLATIVLDVLGRSLGKAFCDRYGNLFCIPDPDVRADEYWGTPAPVFSSEDSGGGPLSETLVTNRTIHYLPYQVRRLTLEAYDQSRMGIFAISENATAPGTDASEAGLLCDDASRLASWAVQKRAQMNREWKVDVSLPLNHTVDICSFVDVCFTAGRQVNPLTASGRTWVSQITYRPDISRGSWVGTWQLLKQTEGQGEAETGAASGWGGSGNYVGNAYYSGDNGLGDGWESPAGGDESWCVLFDFASSDCGFVSTEVPTAFTGIYQLGAQATYVAGTGWAGVSQGIAPATDRHCGCYRNFGQTISISRFKVSINAGGGDWDGYAMAMRTGRLFEGFDFQWSDSLVSGITAYEVETALSFSLIDFDFGSQADDPLWIYSIELEGTAGVKPSYGYECT